jgi:hypothetical protein
MLLQAHTSTTRKIPGGVWAGATRLSACRVGFAALVAPAHTPAERSGKYLALISNRSLQDLNAI